MKKMFAMLLALALLFGCAAAESGEVTCTVASVAADGTAALDTTVEALEAQGFAMGDVVSVIAGGIVCTMPFVGEDADVDAGAMLLRGGSGVPELAIAGGAFTGICPIAPGDTVTLWVAQKEGYLAEYAARSATYKNLRAPDYADASCWVIYGAGNAEAAADVFLLGPTVEMGGERIRNMSLDSETARKDYLAAVNAMRGVFDGECRVFAPYTRQMAMSVYSLGYTHDSACFERAYGDALAAFRYYLENENGGRPIVLAGHSQGSEMLLQLMKDCFGDEALRGRLAAAYLIGWRVTESDLAERPFLLMAQSADDTGVIISYNTETVGAQRSVLVPEGVRALAINPLSWRTDGEPADASLNLGACFTDAQGNVSLEYPALTGAYIDPARGTLKATDVPETVRPAENSVLGEGLYHSCDYAFFYRNLQENVKTRVEAFCAK